MKIRFAILTLLLATAAYAQNPSGQTPHFAAVPTSGSGGGGAGTMTSGTITVPSPLSVTPATITTAGTWAITWAAQSGPCSISSPNDGSSGTLTCRPLVALDIPTLNQNTTGSAAKWTTARLLAGNSADGSVNVAFANKFIVQGTADAGLSGPQFLGALATGIVKNTTTTGVLSIAVAGDFPILNQNTTGTSSSTTGNAATATALAANGTNCTGNQKPSGVDASGNAEGCADIAYANVTGTPADPSNAANLSSGTVSVPRGGTAAASFTAYSPIAAGTTSTGAFQSIGTGTTGQVLFSQGASALASWATRTINTTSPLGGGGSIGADLTLICATCATTTNGGALSATSPATISAAGVIACSTCATTTNGGTLSATSPVTISAAGVIACSTCSTSTGITNSAGNNVVPKSNGTNIVASSIGDDGTTVTIPEAVNHNGSTQLVERLRLSGQEYFQASNTDTNGVSILLGVNRTVNRQPWFCDSAALTQNTTNACIWMLLGGTGAPQMGARATNGSTNLPWLLQPNGGNLGIGRSSTTSFTLDVNGTAGFATSASTPSYIIATPSNGSTATQTYSTELLTLSTLAVNTNTAGNLAPANSRIKAITYRVTTTISISTSFMVSVTGGNAFNSIGTATSAQTGLTSGTTGVLVPAAYADQYNTSATTLTVTTIGVAGTGAIRLTIYYETFVPPIS